MKLKVVIYAISIILFSSRTTNAGSLKGNEKKLFEKEYSFIQQYKVTSPLNLTISTTGGNISTVGTDGNTVEVSFIVALKGKVLDITFDQLKEYAEVEIRNDNSSLSINVIKTLVKHVNIGFSIKTPIQSSATLKTSGGNIDVSGISGNQIIKTSGGNLTLVKLTGNVNAKTSGGNISISNSSADFDAKTSGGNISLDNINGKLDVSTSGGNINAENITKGLLANTSGGNIHLNNVQGLIDVSTSGGDINLEEISGSIKANTSGGEIKATILKLSEGLELKTSGGSITATIPAGLGLDLDLTADKINTQLSNFKGTEKKDRVLGQMNGGGIKVYLSTSSGMIILNFK